MERDFHQYIPPKLICPNCFQPTAMLIDGNTAFCGNDECAMFSWDVDHREVFAERIALMGLQAAVSRYPDMCPVKIRWDGDDDPTVILGS